MFDSNTKDSDILLGTSLLAIIGFYFYFIFLYSSNVPRLDDYRDEGILDRTHVKFYTQQSLCDYVLKAGYDIVDFDRVVTPISKSEFSQFKVELLPAALVQLIYNRPDSLVYQYVLLVASKKGTAAVNHAKAERLDSSVVMNRFLQKIYWMSKSDLTYTEEKVISQSVILNDELQTVEFELTDADGIEAIRLSPADRCGYLKVKQLTIEDINTRVVTELVPQWGKLIAGQLMQQMNVANSRDEALCFFISGENPWFEIDIKALFIEKLADGLNEKSSEKLPVAIRVTLVCSRPIYQDYQPLLDECQKQADAAQTYVNQVAEIRAHLKGLQGEVFSLKDQLAEKEQQLLVAQDEASHHASAVQAIQSSRTWQLSTKAIFIVRPFFQLLKRRNPNLQLAQVEGVVTEDIVTEDATAVDSITAKREIVGYQSRMRLKGKEAQLIFPLSQTYECEYYFQCRYTSDEALIGPTIRIRCGDRSIESENYIYQNHTNTLLFGFIKLPGNADALILTPSRVDCVVTIESFKLSLLSWYNKPIYDNPWYWRPKVYGFRWLLEFSKKTVTDLIVNKRKGFAKREYTTWWDLYGVVPSEALLQQQHAIKKFALQPTVSILMPVYNCPEKYLRKAIESVLAQSYANWQLCIADDCSTEENIRQILQEYQQRDKRIEVVYREQNGHISAASNSALCIATGEYIALLDHDDELAPQALYRVVEALNQAPSTKLFYSDEDIIDADGQPQRGHFKPEWNPDLLRSINYISKVRKITICCLGQPQH